MSTESRAVAAERVVLLDEDATPTGSTAKSEVHTATTPLHLAFSCYVLDSAGRVLVTRRALSKRAWPGVWTNSCCGHPAPGEPMIDAVHRRTFQELGLSPENVRLQLPHFRYRAVDASGIVENEVCPVYTATTERDPSPDPGEVAEWQWVRWEHLHSLARDTPWVISPWAALQIPELAQVPDGAR